MNSIWLLCIIILITNVSYATLFYTLIHLNLKRKIFYSNINDTLFGKLIFLKKQNIIITIWSTLHCFKNISVNIFLVFISFFDITFIGKRYIRFIVYI